MKLYLALVAFLAVASHLEAAQDGDSQKKARRRRGQPARRLKAKTGGDKGSKAKKSKSDDCSGDAVSYDCQSGRFLLEDMPSVDESINMIHELGGDPNASFEVKHDVLSTEDCSAIKRFIEMSDNKRPHPENPSSGMVFVDISANDLVDMIGKEKVLTILEFFHEALGRKVHVTRIFGRFLPADDLHMAYHMDIKKSKLLVELNDDYLGGELIYLTGAGPKVVERPLGTAVVHSSDIVHGVTTNDVNGRYTLFVVSDDGLEHNLLDKEDLLLAE